MLIHDWDRPLDDHEWRSFVRANSFGHLVAARHLERRLEKLDGR